MRHVPRVFHLVVWLTMLGLAVDARADLSLEASLNQLSFAVNQQAMLTITAHGASRISAIDLPEVAGIRFHNRGQSSRINVINGSMSSSITTSYLIEAEKPGVYTIPPIKVTAGSESATTRPLSFEVTAAGTQSGGTGGGERSTEEVAFIRIPELADHYPGELVPITIKAYFNQKYRADINSLPTLQGDGVVMPPLREKPGQTQEVVHGIPYNVLVWKTVLSGIKAGHHPLTFTMDASLLVAQKRRQNSPFDGSMFDVPGFNDPVFDSFFGGYQRKPITVVSPELVFNVVPLPTADQPKNFTGAIGDFTMRVTVNRQEAEVGEPLTLRVEIAGSGNFDRVEAPVFPDSPDWKTYAATSSSSPEQDNSAFGTKVFEQAIVARNSSATAIPALSFSYFDPVRKSYVTRTSEPIAIRLQQSAAPLAPPPAAKAAEPPRPEAPVKSGLRFEGMAPLHVETGSFVPAITPLFARAWFLGVLAAAVLVLVVIGLWRLYRVRLTRHPELVLRRQQNEVLASDLRRVEQACAAGNSSEFLALCRNTIQNQMGLSWQVAPTAISLADLRGRLRPDSPLLEIFDAAGEAAYGGATLSPEKMRDYLAKMKKELEVLP